MGDPHESLDLFSFGGVQSRHDRPGGDDDAVADAQIRDPQRGCLTEPAVDPDDRDVTLDGDDLPWHGQAHHAAPVASVPASS